MTDHRWFKCEQPCEKINCIYCDGGLAFCVVCNKGEAELAPTCPGPPADQSHAWDDLKEELSGMPGMQPETYDEFSRSCDRLDGNVRRT